MIVAADIVFDYRQKVTRSFEYLQGDYYIAPLFMVNYIPPLSVVFRSDEVELIYLQYFLSLLDVNVKACAVV